LGDEDARRAISDDLASTLFVEAGAGSGKTSAMVDRIVRLIRRGEAELREIAAVTFTEAAASELRVRVRRRLESSAASDGSASAAAAALAQIDEAAIGTIHGFCQRLLAEHPLEAELPPGFVVLDEVRASIAWRTRWTTTLDLLVGEEGTRQLVAAAWVLGMDHRHLEAIARLLDEQWDRCDPTPRDSARLLATIRDTVDRAAAEVSASLGAAIRCRELCREPSDGLLARFDAFDAYRSQLGRAGSWIDRLRLLRAGPRRSLRVGVVGRQVNWSGSSVLEVRSSLAEAEEARASAVAVACDSALGGLVSRLESLAVEGAKWRRAAGELSFHDLLVLARNVVANDAVVRSELRRRYRFLLVDEFQDTDPLQFELVELLARTPLEAGVTGALQAGDASDVPGLEPGRLFLVGDPKQAIYRFRGADLRVYEAARQRLGAVPVALTTSFRAVPGIIDFVNATFAELMGERFMPLQVNRDSLRGAVPVRIVGGALGKTLADERRRTEGEAVAAAILAATGEPGWIVADASGDGSLRRARLADVAVLLPSRTGLAILEDALDERQIPYRVESVTLVYGSQEVRDLLALARAIDEPGNETALTATLRSSAFACGDDDLLAFRSRGGSFSLAAPIPEALDRSPVSQAMRELGRLRAMRHALGPVGVLLRSVTDRRMLQIAGTGPRARESWRRLRFVLEQARAFVEAGGGGLSEFADWVDEQVTGNLRAIESTVPDDDEDAVRIMTIHGAKGLEFPVTIIAGLGVDRRGRRGGAAVLRDGAGRAEAQVNKDRSTSGYARLAAEERFLETEEDLRLLYVAATRARDYLVICGHHTPVASGEASLAERLLAAVETAAARAPAADWWTPLDVPSSEGPRATLVGAPARHDVSVPISEPVGDSPVPGGTADQYEQWRRSRELLIGRAGLGDSVAATEIPRLALLAGDDAGSSMDDELLPPWRRPRAGTQLGRAVHAVLQSVDLSPFGDDGPPEARTAVLRPVALAQARAERIPERGGEIERLAAAALSSPVVVEAIRRGTARREVFVAAPVGGRLLEGFVDLCFDDGAGLVVVDYKTDAVRSDADVEHAYQRYRLQAAAYALALGVATGRPVQRCVLMFLAASGRPVERVVTDLPSLESEVRALIAGTG